MHRNNRNDYQRRDDRGSGYITRDRDNNDGSGFMSRGDSGRNGPPRSGDYYRVSVLTI